MYILVTCFSVSKEFDLLHRQYPLDRRDWLVLPTGRQAPPRNFEPSFDLSFYGKRTDLEISGGNSHGGNGIVPSIFLKRLLAQLALFKVVYIPTMFEHCRFLLKIYENNLGRFVMSEENVPGRQFDYAGCYQGSLFWSLRAVLFVVHQLQPPAKAILSAFPDGACSCQLCSLYSLGHGHVQSGRC